MELAQNLLLFGLFSLPVIFVLHYFAKEEGNENFAKQVTFGLIVLALALNGLIYWAMMHYEGEAAVVAVFSVVMVEFFLYILAFIFWRTYQKMLKEKGRGSYNSDILDA